MTDAPHPSSATLLISCPDRKGLVAAVTDFLYKHNGNILQLDQHVDAGESAFFMRVEWDLGGFAIPRDEINAKFGEIAAPFQMTWQLHFSTTIPRMAIFVSKQPHCLYEILSRYQSGEWRVEIPLVISNHADLQGIAHRFGVNFHHFPVTKDDKPQVESAQLDLLAKHRIDLVILARHMQIVSPDFIAHYPNRIINIHHSFLPAFVGAKPYHSAHARGVKLIGATSHYVTAELDAGPIIEQDVVRVNHRDTVEEMIRKGKDVEKLVLARAIRHHLLNQVLVYNNKTVIFG
jgi:formyltetrahydrofolate deformylase